MASISLVAVVLAYFNAVARRTNGIRSTQDVTWRQRNALVLDAAGNRVVDGITLKPVTTKLASPLPSVCEAIRHAGLAASDSDAVAALRSAKAALAAVQYELVDEGDGHVGLRPIRAIDASDPVLAETLAGASAGA